MEHQCVLWSHFRGTNPNTGEPVDEFDCDLHWQSVLSIENAQQTRQLAASVDSLRNTIAAIAQQRQLMTIEAR